jgi:hypothetical protein
MVLRLPAVPMTCAAKPVRARRRGLGGCLLLLQQIERELNGEFLLLPQALEFVECIFPGGGWRGLKFLVDDFEANAVRLQLYLQSEDP